MKGDWHRYNLKRRVAGLPPITSEVFTEKVLQARATTTAEADKAGFERACDACQKTYYSQNSFQNHMSSQKHKAKAAALGPGHQTLAADDEASSVMSSTFSLGEPLPTGAREVDSDAEAEFTKVVESLQKANIEDVSPVKRPSNPHPSAQGRHEEARAASTSSQEQQPNLATPTPAKTAAAASSSKSCLFCNYNSPTAALNVAHMERFHGMFIPEKQYLVDIDGLMAMLQRRIRDDFECLYCGKTKSDVFAVQTHMRDKAHCKIPYSTMEEQLEIGDFYDFRATYSDSESDDDSVDGDKQGGGARLGARRAATATGEDGDEVDEKDNEWETDSSASSLDSADLTAVPADNHYHQYERLDKHPHHTQTDPRGHHQRDGWHSHAHKHNHAVFYDEYELHLPSGKSVGHRSHNRYFRQNLRNYPSPEERAEMERLAIEAGEMDVDSDSGAVAVVRPRGRDLAARARGNPDNVLATLRSTGQKSTALKLKAHQRQETRLNATRATNSFEFRGRT